MEFINLAINAREHLEHKAKRRIKGLIVVFTCWAIFMIAVTGGVYALNIEQQKRITRIQDNLSKSEQNIVQYQHLQKKLEHQKNLQCAAERIQRMFSKPVKGLYLSRISYAGHWEIDGSADSHEAFESYQALVDNHFESGEWTEKITDGILTFHLQGAMAC